MYLFVIKLGDDLFIVGGYGVMICYNDIDLDKVIICINNVLVEIEYLIIE